MGDSVSSFPIGLLARLSTSILSGVRLWLDQVLSWIREVPHETWKKSWVTYQTSTRTSRHFYVRNRAKIKQNSFGASSCFEDCYAYVCLYIAKRSGKWNLRMGAMKSMAALFTAFDRPNYQKLIPQHLLMILEEVLCHLKKGGFTVSIKGRVGHSVGIDEAHEMCINKECKECITRPSADYINRTAMFLPIRAKAMKNIEKHFQITSAKLISSTPILSIHGTGSSHKLEMSIRNQLQKLEQSSLNGSGELRHQKGYFSRTKSWSDEFQTHRADWVWASSTVFHPTYSQCYESKAFTHFYRKAI